MGIVTKGQAAILINSNFLRWFSAFMVILSHTKSTVFLVSFSFSLYVFHVTFTLFMVSVFKLSILQASSIDNMSIFFGVLLITYFFSYLMFFLFEKYTRSFYLLLKEWLLKTEKLSARV